MYIITKYFRALTKSKRREIIFDIISMKMIFDSLSEELQGDCMRT